MGNFWHKEAQQSFIRWANLPSDWKIKFGPGQWVALISPKNTQEKYIVHRLDKDRFRFADRFDVRNPISESAAAEVAVTLAESCPKEKPVWEVIHHIGVILSDLSEYRHGGISIRTFRLELKLLAKCMGAAPEYGMSLAEIGRRCGFDKLVASQHYKRIRARYLNGHDVRPDAPRLPQKKEISFTSTKQQVPNSMRTRANGSKNSATATP